MLGFIIGAPRRPGVLALMFEAQITCGPTGDVAKSEQRGMGDIGLMPSVEPTEEHRERMRILALVLIDMFQASLISQAESV